MGILLTHDSVLAEGIIQSYGIETVDETSLLGMVSNGIKNEKLC
jgi:hypothetical protein